MIIICTISVEFKRVCLLSVICGLYICATINVLLSEADVYTGCYGSPRNKFNHQ
jgi:transcription elongation factor Elf1